MSHTHRWKGENVSTTEVALVVDEFTQIQESNVYGVQIPGKSMLTYSACVETILLIDIKTERHFQWNSSTRVYDHTPGEI